MTDMDKILAGLDDQVRTNIIFDACRNNPMAQQVASASKQVVPASICQIRGTEWHGRIYSGSPIG